MFASSCSSYGGLAGSFCIYLTLFLLLLYTVARWSLGVGSSLVVQAGSLSLSEKGAAILVKDSEAVDRLVPEALAVLKDGGRMAALKEAIEAMEKHDAAAEIVDEIEKYL